MSGKEATASGSFSPGSPLVDYSVVHPVPGYGEPLDYLPYEGDPLFIGEPLPSALVKNLMDEGAAVLPLTTLREFSMLQLMNSITDKDDWHIKIFDEAIAAKWKAEAVEAAHEALRKDRAREAQESATIADHARFSRWPVHTARRDESLMTYTMANYCIDELRHRATLFKQSANGAIVVYNGDVVKSDTAVSPETKKALQKAVEPLENVPDSQKDWHPGSDEKVLDLVHPSLFPVIFGRSKVLAVGEKVVPLWGAARRTGEGNVVPTPEQPEGEMFGGGWGAGVELNPYSTKFQWLPCEVDITGDKPRIISYINNLRPEENADLYEVVEDVIAAAIPLWEMTLAPGGLGPGEFAHFQRISYNDSYYDPDPEDMTEEDGPPVDDDWDLRYEWKGHIRRTVLPEPNEFDSANVTTPEPFSLKDRFGKMRRPLQIIVKLANIELTPENPGYEGGTWHVEGKLNEQIVATALYYYSSKNTTRSSLAFRQLSSAEAAGEMSYEQGVHEFLPDVFGCQNEEGAFQEVGSVETREGRLLTFPNILQHRVQPFELEDKTKPGHRKILALFLVDPNVRILSTAYVPPQQLQWWRKALHEGGENLPIQNLPVEIQDHVYDEVEEFPITLTEAKRLREELMDERKDFVLQHSKAFEVSMTFSLCEH
ncbi:hypothetical protein BKA70DRAFT_1426494 [Coprinopsis sp. MPI-PUGE-AT-0042]|nr:hypothetical protein BKA70DRAFT_1426494 [Coprinopsis sp. MPI-PUGE-AT-0042]